jgi:excisionase family DNA binding protein
MANNSGTAAGQKHDRLLTMTEVCDLLGISRSTFYDWRQAHRAPPCVVLPNRQIRVRESQLNDWVTQHLESA